MLYEPGQEPEELKKYLNLLLRELHATYPDDLVVMDMWNHERWDKVAGYLVKNLGYPNGRTFLNAYGFDVFDGSHTYKQTASQQEPLPRRNTITPHEVPSQRSSVDQQEPPSQMRTSAQVKKPVERKERLSGNKSSKASTTIRSSIADIEGTKPKWITAKLILGIIAMVLFVLVTFQSCAAGLGKAVVNNGEVSGSFGFLSALNLLFSGIIAVAARKSNKKTPWIIAAILLWLNLFYAKIFGGSYSDLEIWGFISFAIGVFYLLSCVHTPKGYIIVGVVSALYLLLSLTLLPALALETNTGNSFAIKQPTSVITSDGQSSQETTVSQDTNTAPVSSSNTTPASSSISAVTINESVLFDQDGIKISSKGFESSGILGPSINLLIENNSNKSITVQAHNSSVNGYMVESMMSVDVAPGKKVNDKLNLSSSDLNTSGISTIADIEFSFHIFDAESWETISDSAPIKIETSASTGFVYSFDNSGTQVYNGNGIEIIVKGLSESDSWLGPAVVVYISNTTGKDISIQAKDVSANGYMIDPVFSCDVTSGKHAIDTITFMRSDLEKNGISSISDVELSFHIYDTESWETIVDTSPVSISF